MICIINHTRIKFYSCYALFDKEPEVLQWGLGLKKNMEQFSQEFTVYREKSSKSKTKFS